MGRYTVAPPQPATWQTPVRCSPGTQLLASAFRERWPVLLIQTGAYGCFNRRLIAGSTTRSVHGDGRALDIGIGWQPTERQRDALNELAAVVTGCCYDLGVQRMLWNGHAWRADRGWRPSTTMGGPHLDHMHLEQTMQAAWTHPPPRDVVRCALGLPL